jgi:hypothetical protein
MMQVLTLEMEELVPGLYPQAQLKLDLSFGELEQAAKQVFVAALDPQVIQALTLLFA